MSETQGRTARLEARIAPETLVVVKRAAEMQGRSVSDFVVEAARQAAMRTIEDMTIIRLSVDDQRSIMKALSDPPQPNEALRRAFDARKRLAATD